ncbi:MAG TPA: hypothetical protein VM734_11225 [Kofleriaceae bacterium]|nr:hypothetical protein [Kofleriaceae bacterium]
MSVACAAIAGVIGACGGSEPVSPEPDAAEVDAADVDAADTDASIDAFGCPPVVPASPALMPRALAVRRRGQLDVFAQRPQGFRAIYTFTSLAHFQVVSWGDANGDGVDDLVTGQVGTSGHELLLFGDRGAGLQQLQAIPGNVSAVAWLRANGDAYDDVWRGDSSYDRVHCGGPGNLTTCWMPTMAEQETRGVAIGDGDADGDADVALRTGSGYRIYRNVGGQFALALRRQAADEDPLDLDWVELDGCGGDELVALVGPSILGPFTGKVWRWTDGGYVESGTVAYPADTRQAFWSDFDRDGDADPLICTDDQLILYRRAGAELSMVWASPIYDCSAAWGDYDADGDDDLAYLAADGDNQAVALLRNDAGTLTEVMREPASNRAGTLAWGRCGTTATSPCFPRDLP